MVLISLTEGFSLILLIPLLQLIGIDMGSGSVNQIGGYISIFFNELGLKPSLILVLIIYVLVISVIAILNRMQNVITADIQYQFAADMRINLYKSITNSNWLFFSRMKSSNFAHALTNEIERVSIGTGQFLTLLASIMILLVYIIFALKLAGLITGIIFIVGVIILLILRKKINSSRTKGEHITTTTQDLYSSIIQQLNGMKTIKSFGMEEENIKIFSKQTDQVAQTYLDTIQSYADVKLLFDVGTVVILSIIVWLLIEVVNISTVTLLILIYLFVRMIPQFSIIQRSYQYFISILPAYNNVITLEKECIEKTDIKGQINDKIKLNNSITFNNVSFSYSKSDNFALENLNLKINAGKTIAIVGSSGSGKTTIADMIMGLIFPDEGELKVDDLTLSPELLRIWRNQIGYVSQETFLFNESIRSNMTLANPNATDKEIAESLKLASAYQFVNNLPEGLETNIGDLGVKLSGGERQRLALARALIGKPSILILDEATSNLDSENETKIMESLDEIHGDITILIIAHRLSTIKNADYVYLIDNGHILEYGTKEKLLKNNEGQFKSIYNSQGLFE
jgi:ATP-binding cassette subfamily C protein